MTENPISPVIEELRDELGPELTRLLDLLQPDDLASLDIAWEAVLAEVLGED